MMSIRILVVFVAVASLAIAEDHAGQAVEGDHVNANNGHQHIDTRDADQLAEKSGKVLDHKGTDKSNTVTHAQLSAVLGAKDHHEDSYSHIHDSAHELDTMGEGDHLQGDAAMAGMRQGTDVHDDHDYDSHHGNHGRDHHAMFGDDPHSEALSHGHGYDDLYLGQFDHVGMMHHDDHHGHGHGHGAMRHHF